MLLRVSSGGSSAAGRLGGSRSGGWHGGGTWMLQAALSGSQLR